MFVVLVMCCMHNVDVGTGNRKVTGLKRCHLLEYRATLFFNSLLLCESRIERREGGSPLSPLSGIPPAGKKKIFVRRNRQGNFQDTKMRNFFSTHLVEVF